MVGWSSHMQTFLPPQYSNVGQCSRGVCRFLSTAPSFGCCFIVTTHYILSTSAYPLIYLTILHICNILYYPYPLVQVFKSFSSSVFICVPFTFGLFDNSSVISLPSTFYSCSLASCDTSSKTTQAPHPNHEKKENNLVTSHP
jgi:hypothetical protein